MEYLNKHIDLNATKKLHKLLELRVLNLGDKTSQC